MIKFATYFLIVTLPLLTSAAAGASSMRQGMCADDTLCANSSSCCAVSEPCLGLAEPRRTGGASHLFKERNSTSGKATVGASRLRLGPSPRRAPLEISSHSILSGFHPVRSRSSSSNGVQHRFLTGRAELFARGLSRVYAGKYLDAISMPLGGIGGGNVQINGKAQLFTQSRKGNKQTELIDVLYGKVRVASIVFQVSQKTKPQQVNEALSW